MKTTQTCKICNTQKEISEFYKQDKTCKVCRLEIVRAYRAKNIDKIREYDRGRPRNKYTRKPKTREQVDICNRVESGVINILFGSMKQRSKLRGYALTITKEEFREWAYINGMSELYSAWANSGYQKKLKPSVDRISDYDGYSFDNMRLVTDRENRLKQYEDIRLGRSTSGERCKPTLCFNSDMELIAEYVSYSEARRAVGYSFDKMIKSHRPDRKNGYIWYYKKDYNQKATKC